MKILMLLLAILLISCSIPSLADYCNLSAAARQEIARILSQSAASSASEDQERQQQNQLHHRRLYPIPIGVLREQNDEIESLAGGLEEMDARKRGLDLGMGRGFSGNQQGKSQVGLIAANMASGPGKRRRRSAAAE